MRVHQEAFFASPLRLISAAMLSRLLVLFATVALAACGGEEASPPQGVAEASPASAPSQIRSEALSTTPYAAGPMAAYSFDEGAGTTLADFSGNGNAGTLVNGPTWTAGKNGAALSFDGNNDRVALGNLDVAGAALTISAWIRINAFTAGDARIISKATGTAEADHFFMLSTINSSGMKLRLRLKTGGTTSTLIAPSSNLSTNTWIHVAAIYDGSAMTLYQNGVPVGSLRKTGNLATDAAVPVTIGSNPQGYGVLNGTIDDLRIYRRALSPSEIQADMATPVQPSSPTPSPAPVLSFAASPTTVSSGGAATLSWSAADATSCTASGAWTGTKPVTGSQSTGPLTATSTYSLACTGPGGTSTASVTVAVSSQPPSAGTTFGLDFPGSAAVSTTMRFRFLNPLSIYPATYIWRAYPRRQAGYYTAFFWGNDDGKGNLSTFLWTSNGGADSYYGAHPYPNPPPGGTAHNWEISIEQNDFTNGAVVYDRWYTQALRVWADSSGMKHHEFYWDLPNADASRMVSRTSPAEWGNRTPPVPALTWGDAPWAPGNEVWNGILRGIQIYSTNLSVADLLSEAATPLSTSAGSASIWYLNLNPTPSDISDKSGRGHHPSWVGSARPALWSGN